ncbi:hypothetical protein [Pseudorhodoferax sp.]|uniref:hypothetical protein n=1 Tax=Pseudorhodoferax sp. TaxID=1993553 RepID=UPI002DD67FED|nr:hypothetical protein [Pseudorhodoferax sp.]
MAKITNRTIAEIDAEFAKWSEFLNGGIGLFAFGLGISCLGTPRPDITALLSLIFLLIVVTHGQRHFPKKLRALREAELSGVDEMVLLSIEKKYFGFAAMFKKFLVYLVGWLFLGAVGIYGISKNFGEF